MNNMTFLFVYFNIYEQLKHLNVWKLRLGSYYAPGFFLSHIVLYIFSQIGCRKKTKHFHSATALRKLNADSWRLIRYEHVFNKLSFDFTSSYSNAKFSMFLCARIPLSLTQLINSIQSKIHGIDSRRRIRIFSAFSRGIFNEFVKGALHDSKKYGTVNL